MSLLSTANHPSRSQVLKFTREGKKVTTQLRSFVSLLTGAKLYRILGTCKTDSISCWKDEYANTISLRNQTILTKDFSYQHHSFHRGKNVLWSGHVIRCTSINNPIILRNIMVQKTSAFITFVNYQHRNRIGRSILRWIRDNGLGWNGMIAIWSRQNRAVSSKEDLDKKGSTTALKRPEKQCQRPH